MVIDCTKDERLKIKFQNLCVWLIRRFDIRQMQQLKFYFKAESVLLYFYGLIVL